MMHRLATLLLLLVCCAAVAFAVTTDQKGLPRLNGGGASPDTSAPDLWGYTWVRSTDPGGPTFNWIDITTRGTLVAGLGDDNSVGPFSIGWNFQYYWYTMNQFRIGSNGYITFGNQTANFAHPFAAQPNGSPPNDMIAILVGDLDFTVAATNPRCYYWTNGVDSLVVSFINVTEFQSPANPNLKHTFQLVLTKRDSAIGFQYGVQQGRFNLANNTNVAIGIENQTGQLGLSYGWSTTPPHPFMPDSGLAVRIQRTVNTGLQVTDAGVVGVLNSDNIARVGQVGEPELIEAVVKNFGTANLTNILVTHVITPSGARDTVRISALAAGQQTTVTFPRLVTLPTAGRSSVTVTAFVPGDQGPGNNAKTAELVTAAFSPTTSTLVAFEGGTVAGSINWTGGGGVGMSFDLPVPVLIENAVVSIAAITAQPLTVEILADSNGAPGRVLATRSVTATTGLNTISFAADSVKIAGTRFYIGARGQISFNYESLAPISYRSWEYTNGWAPYRTRESQDFIIRATVRQLPSVTPQAGWTTQTSGVTTALRSVDAVSSAVVWISGASGAILRTTNAGTTWVKVDSGRAGTGTLHCIDALDANTAFVGANPAAGGYIYRTTNAGARWDSTFFQATGFIDAIKMYDAVNGIALGDPVGGKWTILRTSNGGVTWARIPTEPNQIGTESGYNNSMATFGSTHIWFGTNANRIYRSTNAGVTWDTARVPFASTTAIGFLDATTGVAGAGSAGNAAARTTDGGVTWSSVTIPGAAASVYSMAARGNDFWAVKGTRVYRSTNRGLTWDSVYNSAVGTPQHFSVAAQGGSVAGWSPTNTGGIIAMYVPLTGVREVEHGIPAEFALGQNYPNPFNPSTTIRYTLPTASAVTLTVYNMLGQKVATLADEVQGAGTFEAVWDGRNAGGFSAASGVYLLRIDARPTDGKAGFNAVRKMVLMK